MLEVQCIICDTKVFIDEQTVEAKRLRNNPIRTFMCDDCKSRLDTPKQRKPQVMEDISKTENHSIDKDEL
ncbi:DUF2197 domain-containing protein [Staphylococcus capitis]|uniref:DUF2197 domain-containing protein n=2 Tax=Staphylococcus capitis TaxID=29388 RepID=A0A7Z8E3M9_STACP|nr:MULTISPECIES: DUF2197 domain-containing protein [Staphylococcus]AKL91582.1 hypothetical protein AYP1020_0434 [Staphylococcus capitis subsp. capitis]MBC3079731.1 DUF2197 domain-containing protein [Staphylococcus capitis]MBC8781224.1 DUF2197 domain-containing protein [Staphylococcus capitis]MBE7321326.1 DUF2197 domain-containing protein [Staphylococcus capitis]MBU5290611.1 YlaI family protein [Staphylococcus capitis]